MKLTLLGTGTPTPSLKRMSSSYLIEIGDDVILFDHGPGAHHRLLETGKEAVDVTHMFFTHLHYDHCSDYVRLMLNRWDQGGGIVPDLQVYGPRGTEHMNERLFGEDGAYTLDIRARIELEPSIAYYRKRGGTEPRPRPNPIVREIKAHDVIEGKDWKLTAVNVPHAQPVMICLGFRIDCDAGSVVYSGDAAPSKTLIGLAEGADVLIHMCQRISGTHLTDAQLKFGSGHREVAEVAQAAGVKNCVFSHLTDQMDAPGVKEQLLREIHYIYDGNAIWAEDLLEVPIKGPAPRKLI